MKRRVEAGWRMTLAQLALRVLFGRQWHYISPWKHAGTSAALIVVRDGKILLAQRGAGVEHGGKWSDVGGFLNLDKGEDFRAGVVREFWEETGVRISAESLAVSPTLTYVGHEQEKFEQSDYTVVCGYYLAEADEALEGLLEAKEETLGFGWFDAEEVEAMMTDGRIPEEFTDMVLALRETIRRMRAGERFPQLRVLA